MITNYHAFQLKDAKEIKGVATNTRLLLKGDRKDDPFKETPQAMVSRVLRDLGGAARRADHRAQRRGAPLLPGPAARGRGEKLEPRRAGGATRRRASGSRACRRSRKHVGIKQIFDLSATPFYLKGSGYNEGYIFPWTVSDFSLMDAIESGIVKVPRTPVDDDADRRRWSPTCGCGTTSATSCRSEQRRTPVDGLDSARRSSRARCAACYRSYEKAFAHWETELQQHGEPPPVFIVVCPNTVVSQARLRLDRRASRSIEDGEVVAHKPGNLALLSNVVDGKLARPAAHDPRSTRRSSSPARR